MSRRGSILIAVAALSGVLAASPGQDARPVPATDDPAIQALVQQFFAAQATENAEAYLALWSRSAQRPTRAQLEFIFQSGDDSFTNISIGRVTPLGDRVSVRVSAMRDRTDTTNRRPDGTPVHYNTRLSLALLLERDDGAWKIVSEGSPADTLAAALIAAPTADARDALLGAEPDLVGEMLIASLARSADTAARGQDFATARAIYERVVEVAQRAGSWKSEGQALQNIGNSAYFQREFEAALEAYRRRLAVERDAKNDEGVAEALVGIGTVQYSRYEYSDALASYREAAAIQERLGDGNALGTTLISTGNVQFLQGEYEGAIADYTRSRDLLHKAFNLGTEVRALEGLGRAYAAQGDYAAALEALAGVIAEGRARNDAPRLGNALLSIGDIHFRLGNLDVARRTFEESRSQFETAKDLPSVGHAWQALALTELVAMRFPAAEQNYAKSMAACHSAGDADCVARATVGLAFAQAAQDHYDDAIVTYRKAIDAFTTMGKPVEAARAETGLSQAYLGRKDNVAALSSATRAREAAAALGNDDVVWRAGVAQGRALRRLGAADKALAAAREAVAVLQQLVQRGAANPYYRLPADGMSAYAFLAVIHAERGDAAAALGALESRRAYALRAVLASNERDIWRGMTDAERDEERALSATVVSLAVRIEQEKQLPKPDATRLERLAARLADATAARSVQQERLFARLPALREWRGLGSPVEASALLAAVPSRTAVIETAVDDDDLLVVSVLPGDEGPEIRADVRSVRRQAVAEAVAALAAERVREPLEWRRAGSEVANLFPEGVLARLASAPAAIVMPDDILWRVPFEALPMGDGWIGERVPIAYAASLASLRVPREAAVATLPMLAIAAPDLGVDRIDRIRTTAPGWTPRPADAALAEARGVAAVFDGEGLVSGVAATEGTLRERLSSAALLHVAAPFRISAASPLFSRIYLGRDPAPVESATTPTASDTRADADGTLDLRDVFNLDARASLVALTDPDAAGGRDAASAWPVVRWAWRAAGVPFTLVARWPADPSRSAELMAAFYARLKAGEDPASALRAAQEKARGRDESRAPYLWAGWMLIGG